MRLLTWLFKQKTESHEKKSQQKEKLSFEEAVGWRERDGEWIKSDFVEHKDPCPNHEVYRRILRIKYSGKWHHGKFKPWSEKKMDFSDNETPFFVVITKSGRKMLIPREKVFFTSNFQSVNSYKGDADCDGVEKIHMYLLGNIAEYENMYKKIKKIE